MTSSNGDIFAERPVTRSFDVFFDLHPNKRLSKQWWGWWFETPSCPLWRHCNDHSETTDRASQEIHAEIEICFVTVVGGIEKLHVTMSLMAPQITSISTVCPTVCSGAHQRKHKSLAPLAFVRDRWISLSKPVTRKMPLAQSTEHEWIYHINLQGTGITVTSQWVWWRLKSPATRRFI